MAVHHIYARKATPKVLVVVTAADAVGVNLTLWTKIGEFTHLTTDNDNLANHVHDALWKQGTDPRYIRIEDYSIHSTYSDFKTATPEGE